MNSTTYIVDIDLRVGGSPDAALGRIGDSVDRVDGKAKSLGETFASYGSRLTSGFTGAVETVGGMLAKLGTVGVGAAIGGVTYGVVGLNQELETTQVSLAAVLNSNGLSTSIEGGMERAAGWVAQMKRDARDLPGEFSDLLGIVQSGAGAAFQAGLDDVKFEKLAANAMAAAKSLATPMDQAGRELAHLLQGHAGSQNVFGTRLGLTAENYNEKSRAEQIQMLTAALDKFQPAIKAFGGTFDAQSSTLVDNLKSFASNSTSGLFGEVKGTLAEINGWFEENQSTVSRWATKASDVLVSGFQEGKAIVMEYGPLVLDFVDRAYDRWSSIWKDAKPLVESIGHAVKGFLTDNRSLDKLETIAKLYVAAKVSSGAAGLLGGINGFGAEVAGAALGGGAGGEIGGIAGAAGKLGTALNAGMGAWLAGYGLGSLLGGETAGAYGGAVAGGAAAGGTLGGPWGAGLGAAIGAGIVAYQQVEESNQHVAVALNQFAQQALDTVDSSQRLATAGAGLVETYGQIDLAGQSFQSMLEHVTDTLGDMAGEVLSWSAVARNAEIETRRQIEEQAPNYGMEALKFFDQMGGAAAAIKKSAESDRAKKAAAGSGNVNIGVINMTISNNNAPGQVARDVAKELIEMRRYRKSSPNVFNASAGR